MGGDGVLELEGEVGKGRGEGLWEGLSISRGEGMGPPVLEGLGEGLGEATAVEAEAGEPPGVG